jgi:hypothetical protein
MAPLGQSHLMSRLQRKAGVDAGNVIAVEGTPPAI